MDAIEEEPYESFVSTAMRDSGSIYTFATARTSNSVSIMRDALLSL
jgi:hypothetical protein